MAGQNRRSKYLINPRSQYSFLILSVIMSFISMVILYAASYYVFWKFERTGYEVGITEGHIFFKFMADQKATLTWVFLIAAPIVVAVTSFIGLHMSHRVAGPIYNLTNHIKKLEETGKLSEVKFRQSDYFNELEIAFNNFLKSIEKKK